MTGSVGTAQPEERIAYLEDGTLGVFSREAGGGWYLWKSATLSGEPWLAEPIVPGSHHPDLNAWRRIEEAS